MRCSSYLHEVVVLRVDTDEVNWPDVETVIHVQSQLLQLTISFRHRETVFVVTEIPVDQNRFILKCMVRQLLSFK